MDFKYDIIVVGGGHAGCEAATVAARLGSKTLLITMDMNKFAQMSCNPAIGGIAKGQIVREIDALGGHTGIITDKTSIQFRMLNRSKGPAMWSPRSQCDRTLFTNEWRTVLENTDNLFLWQDTVSNLIIENNIVKGVKTTLGVTIESKAVVLTVGTFLSGIIHVGKSQTFGGRIGETASYGITEQLVSLGFESGRMKTGTPARIDSRSVDFSKMQEQFGDDIYSNPLLKFSYLPIEQSKLPQRSCWITFTSQEVHNTLKRGFDDSPMYSGRIQGIGPRYCPSIEDKIKTFADKTQHHLFLEPEGATTNEIYINGFSSSLPLNIQMEGLRKVKGLENVQIYRPGYAIEYDYFPPTQLYHTLETKIIKNLYFAGQINGTTGYEEAAAQGLMAGLNAHRKLNLGEEIILQRNQAYIGVLIDDLVTKGVDEPYRMFTSRAEYRILLRQDNADHRLTPLAYELGIVDNFRFTRVELKYSLIDKLCLLIKSESILKNEINPILKRLNSTPLSQNRKIIDVLLRSEVNLEDIIAASPALNNLVKSLPTDLKLEILESVNILIKYEGYIAREKELADKLIRLEKIIISDDFDYTKIKSLSTESRLKLIKHKPKTLGQASRIPGVSPSDISVFLVYLGR